MVSLVPASSGCTNEHQTLFRIRFEGSAQKVDFAQGRIAFPTTNGVVIRKGPCRFDLV